MIKKALENILKWNIRKPEAVQCLWDSDFDCIWLTIELVYKSINGYAKKEIAVLSYSDFNSEKELVKEANRIGNEYAKLYKVELYFPSPDKWSRDCPDWWKVSSSPSCEDCNTPIIPTDSKYLPKEVCYPCHLKRKQNEKVAKDEPCHDGARIFLCKNDEMIDIGYCSDLKMFAVTPFIEYKIENHLMVNGVNIITLNEPEIKQLVTDLENELDRQLLNYEMPEMYDGFEKFRKIKIVEYKGGQYKLLERLNSQHKQINRLLLSLDRAKKAHAEKYQYKIYFWQGLTYRDDSMLRFIHFIKKDLATFEQVTDHYKNVLSSEDVETTLAKLKRTGCIEFRKNKISVTDRVVKIF